MKHLAILLLVLAGCLPATNPQADYWSDARLRFRGTMTVGVDGKLVVAFASDACGTTNLPGPCGTFPFNGLAGTYIITPWGAKVPASAGGDAWLGFAVDWRGAGLDPMRDDHAAVLARPWRFVSDRDVGGKSYWQPSKRDLGLMRSVLGRATGIELEIQNDAAAPHLEVIGLTTRGELRKGTRAILALELANRGAGHANLVVARTRSSLPALHGLQFSFGQLAPGTREVRRLAVDLPASGNESDAVIVVEFSEANGFAPAPVPVRLPMHAAATDVVFELTCQVRPPLQGPVPTTVDAGQQLAIDCRVVNRGKPASNAQVVLEVAGSRDPSRSATFDLDTDADHHLTLFTEVPRNAKLDEKVLLRASVSAPGTRATAQATIELSIARPKICPNGRLSRAAYNAQLAKLQKAHADGLLSKEELSRYEFELVSCLE